MSQVSEITVRWTAETSGRVASIQIQSRIIGSAAWTEQAAAHDPAAGIFTFTSNAPGADVEVRTRFRMVDGVFSGWTLNDITTAPIVIDVDEVVGRDGALGHLDPRADDHLGTIQPGATVGAPIGTPVGDLPAVTVVDAIKDGAGNVIKLRDAVPVINAAISAANDRITSAQSDANGRIDAANTRITTAQQTATKAADDLAAEIQRATTAEGDLHTRIDLVAAEGGYDDTAVRALITDTQTAFADADRALGERITGVQSRFVKGGGNLLSNTDFVTLEGWHIGVNLIGATPLSKNNAGPDWQPGGFEDTMGTGSDSAVVNQNLYVTIYSEPFAVTPNDWLQFYVFSASHRCRNWVTLFYYDALGNEIAYAGDYMSAQFNNGGRNPAHWDQLGAKSVKVPANALSARMGLRKYATFEGETVIPSSVAWWWRPYVGLAREGQADWNPYVNGNTKQVQARSNAAIDTAQRTGANANQAVADLTTSVNTRFDGVNGTTATLSDRITTVSDAAGAIGTRTTNLETTINAPGGAMARIGAVETAVTDGRFSTAQRASEIEAAVGGVSGRVSSVETAVSDGRFAASSRVTGVETNLSNVTGRVGTAEGNISNVSGRVSTVETAVSDGRFATSTRVSGVETNVANVSGRVTNVETAVTDGRFADSSRVSGVEASIGNVSGRVSNVETATTDGRFAAASIVNQLRSEYNNTAATVSTQAGTIAGLQGRTSAYIETTVVAANNRAQLAIRADANGGAGVDIVGDVQITGQSGGGRTIISGTGIQVFDANNVLRVRIGLW